MKTKLITSVILIGVIAACSFTNNTDKKPKKTEMKTELDTVSYSLGVNIAKNMQSQGLEELNSELLSKGIDDVLAKNELAISQEEADKLLQSYFTKLQAVKTEKDKKAGNDFLEANKKNEGVVVLPSGLQYKIITEGTGLKPTLTDKVTTHYHGTTIDGKVFDSSVERGQPASFPVNGVIKGWTEALQLMPVGSKWKLFIPSDLAYGARGAGADIPPHAALVFEVELLSIDK